MNKMKSVSSIALLVILLLTSSCRRERLSVKVDYLTADLLASYHVGTPDPRLLCPPIGERVTIRWNIEDFKGCYTDFYIEMKVRFNNLEEETFIIPVKTIKGHSHYILCNEDYKNRCGIQAFKFDLYGDGQLLDTWRHQLYAELIAF